MLTLLKIKNIALIDELQIEFGRGLNLLTGETGSGKSIIVDSLGALTGERVFSDLIKEGEENARIEGLFSMRAAQELREVFDESGIELESGDEVDVIVRREIALNGRNRIFVNSQLVTQTFLKKIGPFLVDIHGQGEQAALFYPSTHLEMLDEFAGVGDLRARIAGKFVELAAVRSEIEDLQENEARKLQLLDILRFQVEEIRPANVQPGEDDHLEEEKRRLNNVEKLSTLSDEACCLLYENEEAAVATLEKAVRRINELAEYEPRFREYGEALRNAEAVLEDLAFAVRDFRGSLKFSPERLEEIGSRLAEISRLKRKYGGTVESVLAHLADSEMRLKNIESAGLREKELHAKLAQIRSEYVDIASALHDQRVQCARKFEKEVEESLKAVALEKARFEVRIESPGDDWNGDRITSRGFDRIEFCFSANVGESVKPISKVASGGEASRLMLILKTAARLDEHEKAMVFDEIDAGIGGRVAEAVGLKLKELAKTQQVLCVTHQPQIASLGDRHFLVEKETVGKKTKVSIKELEGNDKIEEIARMLAGETISDTARRHATEMLAAKN